jgi:hypothetical protein
MSPAPPPRSSRRVPGPPTVFACQRPALDVLNRVGRRQASTPASSAMISRRSRSSWRTHRVLPSVLRHTLLEVEPRAGVSCPPGVGMDQLHEDASVAARAAADASARANTAISARGSASWLGQVTEEGIRVAARVHLAIRPHLNPADTGVILSRDARFMTPSQALAEVLR